MSNVSNTIIQMKISFNIFILFCCISFCYGQEIQVIGAGNSLDIIATSSDPNSNPEKAIDGSGLETDVQVASRFLAHSTLGATIDDIEHVTNVGIENWIDEQQQLALTNYTDPTVTILFELYNNCIEALGQDDCDEEFMPNTVMWRYAWWHNTMNKPDKLRQRVAMALSEILVVSDQSDLTNIPHGIAHYYDILMHHAFGNFEDLLNEVTLSPAMGFYLSHLNNPKTITEENIRPDENYAREIMQLFTIGLYELNQNGTRKIDSSTGKWIPTYDNDDIKGLAKVFTGLSGSAWAEEEDQSPVRFGRNHFRYSYVDQMKMYDEWHEPGAKQIVGNVTIPAGQTGIEDIEMAINHLFNHENVGPFIGRQLIQRLVKSNPSDDYIERISAVFADNGSGVRGDLAAVIKAILLDPEAIECFQINSSSNGMLRSPMIRYTQLMLGLQAETKSDWFWNSGYYYQLQTEQHILSSPTVFNFYSPEYVPNADFAYLEYVGPEFQILNSSTSSNYINWMLLTLNRDYLNTSFDLDIPHLLNETTEIPYTEDVPSHQAEFTDPLFESLQNQPAEFVDYLDLLFANGQLSVDKKENLVNAMERSDVFQNSRHAADYALFMLMIDPDYLIMK